MTVCKVCGTSQGPFVRDPSVPNAPVCGVPQKRKFSNSKAKKEAIRASIRACLARRDAKDRDEQ